MKILFLGSIVNDLGIEWPKLIAQILIFFIVYGILSKFAFGPVTKLLDERRKRIEDGEANLKKIKSDLESANTQASEIIAKANTDAERIIREAAEVARGEKEKATQAAIAEAAAIKQKADEAAKLDRERMVADLKRDFGRLIVDATSKVTGKVLGPDDHGRINQEALAQIAL